MAVEIRKNKTTGKYLVRVTVGYKKGKPIRVSKTFPKGTRRSEIMLWANQLKEEGQEQALQSRMLFDDLINEWLSYKKSHLQVRTQRAYTTACKIHLAGKFQALGDIKTKDIVKLIDGLLDYAPETIIRIRNLLKAMLDYAVERDYISESPYNKSISIPKKKRKRLIKVLTIEQFDTFSHALDTECEIDLALKTFLLTGLRVSELMALQPWHITGTTLRVEQSLEERYNGKIPSPPKSDHAYRTISIPETLGKKLTALPYEDFIFPMGYKLLANSISRRCKEAGVPVMNLQGLRHSHATYLLAKGVSVLAVSRRLGHHSAGFTLSVYGHLVPSMNDKILEVLT